MRFENKYLAVIAYANGFTEWNYHDSRGSLDDFLQKPDFFKPVYDLMNVGDIIQVITGTGAAIVVIYKIENKSCFFKVMSQVKYDED